MTERGEPGLLGLKAFDTWYESAGVRSGPRRFTAAESGKHFFSEALVPHLRHPLVSAASPQLRRYLEAQHLYQWLQFTTHFEVSVVNRAVQRIADGTSGLQLPGEIRLTGYRIMVDECYHSLYSLDVAEQVQKMSGIAALPYDFGPFFTRLDAVGSEVPEHERLVQLLQVVVFETLITSILEDIPGDESVLTVVRDIVRDHAADERRHHAFFATLFRYLWGQLDPALRHRMGLYLPDLIVRSLWPPVQPAHRALVAGGCPEQQARQIVAESYDRPAVLRGIRAASAKTVRLFQANGLLDLPDVQQRFAEAGLLPGTGP